MSWALNFFIKVEPVPGVLKYCKEIKKCHWVLNMELCLAMPQPGFCTVLWCLCLPWAWLQARKGNLFIFLQHNWYCSLCPASCPLFSLHFRVGVCTLCWTGSGVCMCLCVHNPECSDKDVAGMFPVFSSCNLWMLVIEQLFIYIYINISINKQVASSFSCNFSVYREAWVYDFI